MLYMIPSIYENMIKNELNFLKFGLCIYRFKNSPVPDGRLHPVRIVVTVVPAICFIRFSRWLYILAIEPSIPENESH